MCIVKDINPDGPIDYSRYITCIMRKISDVLNADIDENGCILIDIPNMDDSRVYDFIASKLMMPSILLPLLVSIEKEGTKVRIKNIIR